MLYYTLSYSVMLHRGLLRAEAVERRKTYTLEVYYGIVTTNPCIVY